MDDGWYHIHSMSRFLLLFALILVAVNATDFSVRAACGFLEIQLDIVVASFSLIYDDTIIANISTPKNQSSTIVNAFKSLINMDDNSSFIDMVTSCSSDIGRMGALQSALATKILSICSPGELNVAYKEVNEASLPNNISRDIGAMFKGLNSAAKK